MKNKFRFLLCFILILSIVVCSSCGQEQKGKKLIKSFVSDAETCGGIDFYKTDGNIVCFVSVERVSEDVSTMMVYKTTVGEDNTVEASDVYLVAVASTGAAAIYKIPATTDENSDNRISDSWTVINYLTLDSLNTFARVAAKKNVSYLPSKISLDYD
ncbi:MAG: hypothetical protein II399_09515, partial [Lachnospiraceae bacterium]|nr:hypothetical protein [Lachnospiraceae bacterium]